jgi:opacity protein-like surface antigen
MRRAVVAAPALALAGAAMLVAAGPAGAQAIDYGYSDAKSYPSTFDSGWTRRSGGRHDYVAVRAGFSELQMREVTAAGSFSGTPSNSKSFEVVSTGALAIGLDWRKWNLPIRSELEYAINSRLPYSTAQPSPSLPNGRVSSDMTTQTLSVNLYYDLRFGFKWVPYFQLGAGYGWNTTSGTFTDTATGTSQSVDKTKGGVIWSGGVGVAYPISDVWIFDLGYRISSLGHMDIGTFSNGLRMTSNNITRHDLLLGVRYRF